MAARDHFLDRHMCDLIQKISVVEPVVRALEQTGLLTNEQYNLVDGKPTSQEQMRELYRHWKDWGRSAKDKVCECLRAANPSVLEDLEVEPQPGVAEEERAEEESRDLDTRDHDADGAPEAAGHGQLFNEYGDITNVDCTGASRNTAQRDGLLEEGVPASHKMAQMDSFRMRNYRHLIESEAERRNIDPAIIAGIISRESRAGEILMNGWGHDGNTFGLMQVCLSYHDPVGEWDSAEHIEQATGILISMIEEIQINFPQWSKEQQLKGGIAAYNCGDMNIDSYEEVDKKTVLEDYSNDTVARAQWYKENWHLLSP